MSAPRALSRLLLAYIFVSYHNGALAQSVDSCMSSKGEAAITTCQQLLDNGSRSAAVYYQLSSQLYQTGKVTEALASIDIALTLHPGNTLLTSLKKNIVSNSTEQLALKESSRKNESAMTRGQLKITCLTKNGTAGLRACRGYLAQTNVDADRIRVRENELIAEIGNEQNTAPADNSSVVAASTATSTAGTATQTTAQTNDGNKAASRAQRQLVKDLQTELSALGFNVGVPDGVVGRKTRSALTEFYQRSNLRNRAALDAGTLNDVRSARAQLSVAEGRLQDSRQLATNGQLLEALAQLDSAERTSSFIKVPPGFRQNLNLQLTQSQQNTNSQTQATRNTNTAQPATASNSAASTASNNTASQPKPTTITTGASGEQLTQLLAQIKALESRLNLRKSNNTRQSHMLRAEVSALFDN